MLTLVTYLGAALSALGAAVAGLLILVGSSAIVGKEMALVVDQMRLAAPARGASGSGRDGDPPGEYLLRAASVATTPVAPPGATALQRSEQAPRPGS